MGAAAEGQARQRGGSDVAAMQHARGMSAEVKSPGGPLAGGPLAADPAVAAVITNSSELGKTDLVPEANLAPPPTAPTSAALAAATIEEPPPKNIVAPATANGANSAAAAKGAQANAAIDLAKERAPAPATPEVSPAAASPTMGPSAADLQAQTRLSPEAPPFVPVTGDDIVTKLPARHRSMLRGGFHEPMTGQWYPYYVGSLKSFSGKSGYGFIHCPQAKAEWGADVFIHKSLVPTHWHLGQPLEFAVNLNTRGQPQCIDVNWLPRIPDNRRQEPMPRPLVVDRAPPGLTLPMAAPTGQGPDGGQIRGSSADGRPAVAGTEAVRGHRHLGTLKSFSASQGYGFIACEPVFEQYKRDVYFDKSQLSDPWRLGQTVEFQVVFNARGHPQARKISWDPVPSLPPLQGAPAQSSGPRSHSTQSFERLQKLLGFLNARKGDTAVVNAIEFHGSAASPPPGTPASDADRDVDFVSFVLDRLEPPEAAMNEIKDFVKMLLMLMITKMLKRQLSPQRCKQLVNWFRMLAETINPERQEVKSHFRSVVGQMETHLQAAEKEHLLDRCVELGPLVEVLKTSLKSLKEKANS